MSSRDAFYTRKVNDGFILLRKTLYGLQWVRNNSRQIREVEQIISEKGYPEERLIGVSETVYDSVAMTQFISQAGISLTLQNRQVFFMYLHYYTTRRNGVNPILWAQVQNGNMPVYQYARIHDYLADKGKFRYAKVAYHEFDSIRQGEDTTGLDARRSTIGLPPFAIGYQIRNIAINREFSGKANKEIILD